MSKKSSNSRPVPWGFKILAGLQVVYIIGLIFILFLPSAHFRLLGYLTIDNPVVAPTAIIIGAIVYSAALYSFFSRPRWGFYLNMILVLIQLPGTLVEIVSASSHGQTLTLAIDLISVVINLLIAKYLYDRRWYFNK